MLFSEEGASSLVVVQVVVLVIDCECECGILSSLLATDGSLTDVTSGLSIEAVVVGSCIYFVGTEHKIEEENSTILS
jgi:hypothetical protein